LVPARAWNWNIWFATLKFHVTFLSFSTTDSYKSVSAYAFVPGCTIKVLLVEYWHGKVLLRICGRAVKVTCAGISISQICIKLLCRAVIPHRHPLPHRWCM
jgi:hypothetical protein